jgi:hypothetical protein
MIFFDPEAVEERLRRAEEEGLVERAPNLWQVSLGIARMWHRVVFRSGTIGTCRHHAVRSTWRARLLAFRPARFPFLLAEGAISPWDLSGLLSSTDRVVSHLLAAHHDGLQFVYDLQLLRCHPGALERVREQARRVVEGDDRRSAWLRDLVVFERYHENLLEAVERELEGAELSEEVLDDPDITLSGYLRWCAAQPPTPGKTLEAAARRWLEPRRLSRRAVA